MKHYVKTYCYVLFSTRKQRPGNFLNVLSVSDLYYVYLFVWRLGWVNWCVCTCAYVMMWASVEVRDNLQDSALSYEVGPSDQTQISYALTEIGKTKLFLGIDKASPPGHEGRLLKLDLCVSSPGC